MTRQEKSLTAPGGNERISRLCAHEAGGSSGCGGWFFALMGRRLRNSWLIWADVPFPSGSLFGGREYANEPLAIQCDELTIPCACKRHAGSTLCLWSLPCETDRELKTIARYSRSPKTFEHEEDAQE